jgi:hypothetical protein
MVIFYCFYIFLTIYFQPIPLLVFFYKMLKNYLIQSQIYDRLNEIIDDTMYITNRKLYSFSLLNHAIYLEFIMSQLLESIKIFYYNL